MASDDSSGSRPAAPIVLRIKLRYDDADAMVQRFAANVGKSGLFLPTRSLQPLGAEIKFELRLADDTPVLVGLGRVKAAVPPDPQHPRATFGMAIELQRVTPQSRALILRMLERRRELGLPELGLPMASDIDAARRAEGAESGGRDPASGPVRVASSPSITPPPVASSPSITPPPVVPADVPSGEALLTAPRRTTGPMAAAKLVDVAPLPPEPPRKRRMAISEIIESASGPVASVSAAMPGLDDDVDVAATLARARALASGALDAELEALSQVAAAPLEISIDAASAELARQLGGSAVRRDRSAGWAPPPATAGAPPAPASEPEPEPPEPVAPLAPAQPEPLAPEPSAPPAPALADGALPAAIADQAPAHAEAGERPVVEQAGVGTEADDPGEDGEGAHDHRARRARSFAPAHVEQIRTEPSGPISFGSPREDSGVAAALADLDADEHTEMGEVPVGSGGFEPLSDGDGEGAGGGASTTAGEIDPVDRGPDDRGPDDRGPEAIAPPLELSADEFEGFEIIAEADADDEDLLASDGEHDASNRRELHLPPQPGERRPSELDFAARLDLGDESDLYIAMPADEFSAHHVIDSLSDERTGEHAPRRGGPADSPGGLDSHLASSAGAALALFETGNEAHDQAHDEALEVPLDGDGAGRFEPRAGVQPIFEPEPSSSFTIASVPSDSIDLDLPPVVHAGAVDPGRAARRSGAIRSGPAILRKPPSLHEPAVGGAELENALEALDVDLDDLSVPRTTTPVLRGRSRPIAAARQVEAPRTPAQPPRASVPTPAPARPPRASAPTPAPARPPRASVPPPAPGQPPRAPAAAPSRAVRHAGHPPPGSGRVVAPRAPSESVDIDLDDDD